MGAVPVKLDAVAVRIAQIKRLADAVVGRAIERHVRGQQTLQRIGQRGARRIQDRDVVQAGRAGWRRRAAFALPGIQTDVVMIAARGEKGRLVAEPLLQLEPEHAAVEGERAVEVGHLQMHVADADVRVDWPRRQLRFDRWKWRGHVHGGGPLCLGSRRRRHPPWRFARPK